MAFLLISFCKLGRPLPVAIVVVAMYVMVGLPLLTTAVPLKDVLSQLMMTVESEDPHRHHTHELFLHRDRPHRPHRPLADQPQHPDQPQTHRQKRSAPCEQPTTPEANFQNVIASLADKEFVGRVIGGQAFYISAEDHVEQPFDLLVPIEGESCPSPDSQNRPGSSLPGGGCQLCAHRNFVHTLKDGYYPHSLKWAECCFMGLVGNGTHRCEEVTRSITVLRPIGCFFGLQKYVEDVIEGVPVSCNCVKEI